MFRVRWFRGLTTQGYPSLRQYAQSGYLESTSTCAYMSGYHGNAKGFAQHVPDDERDGIRAAVTDIDTQHVRRNLSSMA